MARRLLRFARKNKLLFGYGYFEIIPAMDTPVRQGNDGTNEHVHNFIINILARAGIIGVAAYLFLIYQIIKLYYEKQMIFKY